MSSHSHFHAIEQAVIRNKWFTLAAIALMFLAFTYVKDTSLQRDYSERALKCHDIAVSVIHSNGYNVESWRAAKAQFNTCLLVQGVTPGLIPAFDEMFPYPIESDDAYVSGQSDAGWEDWE
jgi:hypothetical protein